MAKGELTVPVTVATKLDSSKLIAQARLIAGAFQDLANLAEQISASLHDAADQLEDLDLDDES
jgi:hypothetical protein